MRTTVDLDEDLMAFRTGRDARADENRRYRDGLRALLEREARRRLRALEGKIPDLLPCGDAGHEAGSGRHLCLALLLCWASDCSSFGDTLGRGGHRFRASAGRGRARLGWAFLGSGTPTAKTSDRRMGSYEEVLSFISDVDWLAGDRLGRCRDHHQRPDIRGRGVVIRSRGRRGCWRARRGVRCECRNIVTRDSPAAREVNRSTEFRNV